MTDGRPKIIKEFNVADEIEQSNIRRANKGLNRIMLEELHELAQHLKYDCAHRILPKFRANPRATHPALIGRAS